MSVDVYQIYSALVAFLRTIPAHHVPSSHLSYHADPLRRGKDERAISVTFHINDTSDALLPPQVRFDSITMKFMLVGDRFVRTTPKEISEAAKELAGRIEAIVLEAA